jgi:hypothetical protein
MNAMKKSLWIRRIVFCGVVCCGFTFLSVGLTQQPERAELTNFSGTVDVLLEGADGYVSAQDGMMLEAGDKIKTGSGASAELSFNEDNTNLVRISENSAVKVSFSGDEKLEMDEGEVFTSISNLPSGSAFEIRTPTAVSGARGTDWVTKVTEEGTDVEAMDNTPYVRHFQTDGTLSKEQTFIIPGQMTRVQKFQRPMAPRQIPFARRQQWHMVKQDVRKRAGEAMMKRQQRPPFDRKEFLKKNQGMGPGKDNRMLDSHTQKPRNDAERFKPKMDQQGERFKSRMDRQGERFEHQDNNRRERLHEQRVKQGLQREAQGQAERRFKEEKKNSFKENPQEGWGKSPMEKGPFSGKKPGEQRKGAFSGRKPHPGGGKRR